MNASDYKDLIDWATRIELVYRAYAREHRSVEDQFEDVLSKFVSMDSMTCVGKPVTIAEPETVYFLMAASDVPRAREKGLLVLDESDGFRLIVRQWTVTIQVERAGDAKWFVTDVLDKTGRVWTNVRIVNEVFTDVGPQ